MDKVRKYTDEELKKLERKLSGAYSSAQRELKKKWKEYMTYVNNQVKPYQAAYDAAVKSGLKTEIADAKAALDNIKRDLTLSSPRYNEMVDNLTERMAHVNETALSYINDKVPSLYMANHNAIAPTAKSLGIDFTIINKNTLKNVTMARSLPLPKKLNIAKDKRWNEKFINSQMLQGILQGEPMDKISARIFPEIVAKADKSKSGWLKRCEQSAIRNARTMVTQAENKGRLDSYHELEDMGTVLKKRWIATADEFTREEHLLLDGEEVDLDESFSNGLMYPGDPEGDPSEVYNCRCSMETVILGFMDADGNINYVDQSLHEDSGHHEQIEEEIDRRKDNEDQQGGKEGFHSEMMKGAMSETDYKEFTELVKKSENGHLYERHADDISGLRRERNGGAYSDGFKSISFSYEDSEGMNRYSTLAHEYNHFFDTIVGEGLKYSEVDLINERCKIGTGLTQTIKRKASQSDEFLAALRKDMDAIRGNRIVEYYKKFKESPVIYNATGSVQDALDGFYSAQKTIGGWGHGDRYYNRGYNKKVIAFDNEKNLKQAFKEMGFDASNQKKVKRLFRQYETASEAWANVGSAVTCGGEELKAVEKYMPNTLKAYKKIVGAK